MKIDHIQKPIFPISSSSRFLKCKILGKKKIHFLEIFASESLYGIHRPLDIFAQKVAFDVYVIAPESFS